MDMPNALKYRQSFDPTCSCRRKRRELGRRARRRRGQARARVEGRRVRHAGEVDRTVAAEVRRQGQGQDADRRQGADKPAAQTADPGVDALSQQAATISREASGIAGGEAQTGASYGEGQGQTVEVVGPDGVKRQVRIIDPTL